MDQTSFDLLSQSVGPGVILLIGFFVVFWLAMMALMISSMWIVFQKAGKPGWAAIVPIYNMIVMLEMSGRPGWWVLLMLIPLVNIVFVIILYVDLSKSFGHGGGFAAGLMLLSIVFWPILAFGESRYVGPAGPEGRSTPVLA
ncbi:MAG: DUF5684 domain-containing protein [Acidobacteriota bacterium]